MMMITLLFNRKLLSFVAVKVTTKEEMKNLYSPCVIAGNLCGLNDTGSVNDVGDNVHPEHSEEIAVVTEQIFY